MANPFLVLGGIAVGIVTATFGVLAVPGWVASAQDAATSSDLSLIANAQAASASKNGTFTHLPNLVSGWDDDAYTGMNFEPSQNVESHVSVSQDGKRWAAISVSPSGRVLARTSDAATVHSSPGTVGSAPDDPIAGSAIPAGLPAGITVGGTRSVPTITFDAGAMPENIVVDASFTKPSRWTLVANTSIAPDGRYGDGGSLQIDARAGVRSVVVTPRGGAAPAQPGQVWRISGWYRTSADWNGTVGNSKFRLANQSNTLLRDAAARPSAGEWVFVEAQVTISAPTTSLTPTIVADHTLGTIWWDNIELTRVG